MRAPQTRRSWTTLQQVSCGCRLLQNCWSCQLARAHSTARPNHHIDQLPYSLGTTALPALQLPCSRWSACAPKAGGCLQSSLRPLML